MLVHGLLKAVLITAFSFNNSTYNEDFNRDLRRTSLVVIQSPRVTNYGDWTGWQYCPEGSFASGMELKVENSQGKGDDTALNAIRIICGDWNGKRTEVLETNAGDHGAWRGENLCHGLAYGFQLKSENDQGLQDDTAANDMKLFCATDKKDKKELEGANIVDWGKWTDKRTCPSGTAICGINAQVEKDLGEPPKFSDFLYPDRILNDDTALNNVDMACCKVPDPASTCDAKYDWTTIYSCSAGLACKVTFKSSLSYTESNSESTTHQKEVSEDLGYSLGASGYGLTANFEHKFGSKEIDGLSIDHMISTVSTEETTFEIDMTGCQGKVQQMILTCGLYKVKTQQYRCRN